jgi:hypothetical protein
MRSRWCPSGVIPTADLVVMFRWLALVHDPVHPVQGNPLPHNLRRALYVSWGLVHSGWNCASGGCSPCCSWDWCSRHSSSATDRSAGSTLSEGLDLLEGLILPFCLTHRDQECSLCCLLCFHCSSHGCWQCCCLSFADPAERWVADELWREHQSQLQHGEQPPEAQFQPEWTRPQDT